MTGQTGQMGQPIQTGQLCAAIDGEDGTGSIRFLFVSAADSC